VLRAKQFAHYHRDFDIDFDMDFDPLEPENDPMFLSVESVNEGGKVR